MFKVKNLNKKFKLDKNKYEHVLNDINFEIRQGSFTTISGESGSGKSTLLNTLTTLDKKYEGEVYYRGTNLRKINSAKLLRGEIGFIFQNFQLINDQNVYQNIEQGLMYIKKIKRKKAIKEALKLVGLEKFSKKKISQLSGGQKQRVAIARAIVKNPNVIVADEPTGSLDAENRDNVIAILKELNQQGKTIIMVTHDPELAMIGTQVIKVKDGKIEQIIENSNQNEESKLKNNHYTYRNSLRPIDIIKAILSQYRRRFFRILLSIMGLVIGSGVLIGINALQTTLEKELNRQISDANISENESKKLYVEITKKTTIDEVLKGYNVNGKTAINNPIKTDDGLKVILWDSPKIEENMGYYQALDYEYLYSPEDAAKLKETNKKLENAKSDEERNQIIFESQSQGPVNTQPNEQIEIKINGNSDTIKIKSLYEQIQPNQELGRDAYPPGIEARNQIWVKKQTYQKYYDMLTQEQKTNLVKYYQVEFSSLNEAERFSKEQENNPNVMVGPDQEFLLEIRRLIEQSFIVLFVIVGFISLISIATILIISYIRIRDGRKEYAIRKVLGFSNLDLAKYSIIDNTFQIIIGFSLGYILFDLLKKSLQLLFKEDGFSRISNPSMQFMLIITVGTGLFVGLVTAILTRKIRVVEPAEALRYE